jgi:hypothetical protein
VLADGDEAAGLLLQVGRGGQVVGMGVRLEDPLQAQPLLAQMGQQQVRRPRGRS